jgi:hypothetical protein
MIQGTFGVIQGTLGVIQGTFGVIQMMMMIISLAKLGCGRRLQWKKVKMTLGWVVDGEKSPR